MCQLDPIHKLQVAAIYIFYNVNYDNYVGTVQT